MPERKSRHRRRHWNAEESEAMGFVDLQENADEDGWPYPDDDDEETTENYMTGTAEERRAFTRRQDGRAH